jgi:hypothetical protein
VLVNQVTLPRPQFSPWGWLSAARDRLKDRAAMDRLHRATQDTLAALSDHERRDLGLAENPYRRGGLRSAGGRVDQLTARLPPRF